MSLATLPGELYTAIIQHLEPSCWTEVVLTLSRVLPSAPIPIQLLFHSIRIRRARQAVALLLRLRKALDTPCDSGEERIDPCASWVKEFSVETWTVDADVVIDIVRLLPNLSSLNVRIGPSNISPEHLEQLFQEPIGMLMQLSLRFRPYLKRASYYQFHQGVYFDSTLSALAKWPPQKIPRISIVQDPQQDANTEKQTFAQPIVFFLLDPHLSVLVHSPSIAHSMTALRLRIPSRPVARPLCILLLGQKDVYHSPEASPVVPNLEFLDLSTCGVIEGELEMILARFRNLKHLIIDGCAVLRAEIHQGEWGALGKRCALIGVHRAREREKELKAQLEEGKVAALGSDGGPAQVNEPRRPRPGRRGLATPTISIRDRSSGIARSPGLPKPKIRILPFVSRLVTLATTTTIGVEPCRHAAIRSEFEAGWTEGMAQLEVTYARLRTSSRHGVRLLREDGEAGLEDVDVDDDEAFVIANDTPPILCLAGPTRNEHHVANCGHLVGWSIWHETLTTEAGVEAYLRPTEYACTRVETLTGGTGNWAFRLWLCQAHQGQRTLVLKHGRSYIKDMADVLFDVKRQLFEVEALKRVREWAPATAFVTVPSIYHYDDQEHAIIMSDCGCNSMTLKEYLQTGKCSPETGSKIGKQVGDFMGRLHAWGTSTDVCAFFNGNQEAKAMYSWAYYGRLLSTFDQVEIELEEEKRALEQIVEESSQAIMDATSTLVMGDFWPGNLVVRLKGDEVEQIYVLDWELCRPGIVAMEVGQFCAELVMLRRFGGGERAQCVLEGFLEGYRVEGEMWRQTAVHMGVHGVVMAPRMWGDKEKMVKLVLTGMYD